MTHEHRSAKLRQRARLVIPVLVLAGIAACGRSGSPVSDDLSRDLELAKGQGLELAPRGGGQSTVSATELLPRGQRTASTSPARAPQKALTVAPKRATPVVAEAPEPAKVEMPAPANVETPDPVPATPAPARPQPASAKPAMNPAPPGGYKGMGELIRKAPFPINP